MSNLESGKTGFRMCNVMIKTRKQYRTFLKFIDNCEEVNIIMVTIDGDYKVLPFFFKRKVFINALIMYHSMAEIEFEF